LAISIMATALAALGPLCGTGCSEKKRTEIIVGVATDLDAPAPLAKVLIQAYRLPQVINIGMAERAISGDGVVPYSIPATFGVYSDAGTPDRVRVKLTATDGTNVLVVRTAVMSLVPEKTLFVRLGVVSACMGRNDCDPDLGQTCVDGRCVSEAIDSATLPAHEPGMENHLGCASVARYVDTGTKQPLAVTGPGCASGLCAEGVCLNPPEADGGLGGAPSGGPGGASGGAGGAGGAAMPPQITSVLPTVGTAGTPVTLEVHGEGITAGWTIYFDGAPVATQLGQAADGPIATAPVAIPTAIATGQVPVWLSMGTLVSNTVYFTVMPAAGSPSIVDYTPDNALPGTTISIVGSNLTVEPVTITDPLGRPIVVQTTGTTTWLGLSRDRVDVMIPADMPTGVLTASNSKGSFRGRVFNVGQNLSRLPIASATSSTQYNTTNWSTMSGWDNNLQTSWFSANGDCASTPSCTRVPYYQIAFATPQTVARIAMRGNREYASGYDFVEGRFDILDGAGGVLWSEQRLLPDPDRDLDLLLSPPVANAAAVKFTSISDQSVEPGFSELEVFGP
jgi:hypothetical protein